MVSPTRRPGLIWRWTNLFAPTLRSDPADADSASHRLLLRAGMIRQLMAGHYSLLPLALRTRGRIIAIIREEMERIGAQEFLLPALHPTEIWERSGRLDVIGDEMFRLHDRRHNELALGFTHEEIFATLAQELHSYRQLPQIWFQFQTKFRDEPRPKSGLVRVREFTMKDSYSFDLGVAGLERAFDAHRAAYRRIFERLGVPVIEVTASSGTMGGTGSIEFMTPSPAGEDTVIHCPDCGYAANSETASSAIATVEDETAQPLETFPTPDVKTIVDLEVHHRVASNRQIKTLVYAADSKLVLVLLRGDHMLMEQKLRDQLGCTELRPARIEEIAGLLGATPGSLGAVGVDGPHIYADRALEGRREMVTGANRDGFHLRHVDIARDVRVARWLDLREVHGGEPCAQCGSPLEATIAIEVGHIFKLGTRYSRPLGVDVLTRTGERQAIQMGSYGIGVERVLAAIVEAHHDDDGIIWPAAVSPFDVIITQLSEAAQEAVASSSAVLAEAGFAVLIDDRDERPGVKFRDADLIGIPLRVVVGGRNHAAGLAEVRRRDSGEVHPVPLADLARVIGAMLEPAAVVEEI